MLTGGARKWSNSTIAALLGCSFLLLYLLTLCKTVFWYDSAEYATAAATLGIPHPPGYPLYTLIGHVFTWLPIEPAVAVNAMSAFFAAVAVGLAFLVARELDCSRGGSIIAAATLGSSSLFWSQAVIAEVYCPAQAVVLTTTLLLLRAQRTRSWRHVAGASAIAGLGLGIHLSVATCGLGFALLVWSADGSHSSLRSLASRALLKKRARRALMAAVFAALGSLIFLYLPVRASMDPALNFGDPSTPERFIWHLTGGNYKGWFLTEYDFFDRLLFVGAIFYDQLLVAGLALAGFGVIVLARRAPIYATALAAMAAGNLYFFFTYRVHDVEVFFLPTTVVLCLLIAPAIDGAVTLANKVGSGRKERTRRMMFATFAALPLLFLATNYAAVDMNDFDETDEFMQAAIETLPQNAVILNFTTPPEWKVDAVFGMYMQKVKHQRTDVRVIESPVPRDIIDAMRNGLAVYCYTRMANVAHFFEMEPAGPFYRVLRLKPRPPSGGEPPPPVAP